MKSEIDLSQQALLFDLITLANKHLALKYHGVFRNCPHVREELDGIKNLLGLALDEINRLTNDEKNES